MKNKLSDIARFLLFFGIGIFFIWLSLRDLSADQRKEILNSFSIANYWWIALAILLGVMSHYLRALRWKMLLEPMGYHPGNRNTFFAVMIGYLANLAIPRLGEVSRCTILTRYENIPFTKSFGTVITERALDLFVFVLLFFLNLALQYEKLSEFINQRIYIPLEAKLNLTLNLSGGFTLLITGIVLLFGIVFLIMRKRIIKNSFYLKFKKMLLGFFEGIKSLTKVKNLWVFIFLSLAIWALYLIMAYFVFFSLPETSHVGIKAGLAVLVFGTFGIMLSQGGLGVYPFIVMEVLLIYFVEKTMGLALGWLIWSSQTLTIIVLGSLSLILLPLLNKKISLEKA